MAQTVIEHRDAPLGERHSPINWLFANDAEREATAGFTPGDVGKWAYQTDISAIWRLATYFSDYVWQLVGVAGGDLDAEFHERRAADIALQAEIDALVLSAGADKTYVHDQNTASAVWTVTHNLGKFPSVSVVDTLNRAFVGLIEYTNNNVLTVTFNASMAGKAYCN